jgi:RimJ/RimL family protein N-acetyltransferase
MHLTVRPGAPWRYNGLCHEPVVRKDGHPAEQCRDGHHPGTARAQEPHGQGGSLHDIENIVDVLLRDVLEGDLPTFFEHQLDPAANRMAAFAPRDNDAFMAHWKKILADTAVAKKTILFDGHVAGNIVSFERSGKREVGYWIGREYWGKGIATEALLQFLRHVTERPLYALVAKHNVASIRVLEKCGFAIADHGRGSPGARGPVVLEVRPKSLHRAG